MFNQPLDLYKLLSFFSQKNMYVPVNLTFDILDIKCHELIFMILLDISLAFYHNKLMNTWVMTKNVFQLATVTSTFDLCLQKSVHPCAQ